MMALVAQKVAQSQSRDSHRFRATRQQETDEEYYFFI